jgi:hypothetical protein
LQQSVVSADAGAVVALERDAEMIGSHLHAALVHEIAVHIGGCCTFRQRASITASATTYTKWPTR